MSMRWPSAPSTSNLYQAPAPTPGTNSSHTPHWAWRVMGWLTQALKSPARPTLRACGAHTANAVPAWPLRVVGCAPSFSQGRWCLPSASSQMSSAPSQWSVRGCACGVWADMGA